MHLQFLYEPIFYNKNILSLFKISLPTGYHVKQSGYTLTGYRAGDNLKLLT